MATTYKLVFAGPVGAGKTTAIQSLSDIEVVRTEASATDDVKQLKQTTTVAMDFGRITLDDDLVLYLFGTPGQQRFWFMWDELSEGALGAVELADTRRLEDSFAAVDYFERRSIPFLVAVNCFDGAVRYPSDSVRQALDLDPGVPVVLCDARDRQSAKDVLIDLIEHAMRYTADHRQPVGS